jgi:hypothetical protein
VRDPVLREALSTLAAEAATRLRSLVATGDEIPFDVAEDSGESTRFYRYVPLTSRFVAEREDELRSLPSFGPACAAVSAAGIAVPYLEARGATVPADPDERAGAMLVSFIAGLWEGSAEFSLDPVRLRRALAELDAETRDVHESDLLIAPIVGLQMPLPRLQLPSGVRVVRADTVDAPIEAMRSEGMQRAAWEPQYLALAEQGEGPEGVSAALAQLHDLISVLRLYREGGIGLGPYAFAPVGEQSWRRIATGAAPTRPGGYQLSEDDSIEVRGFAHDLEVRPDPDGAMAWAVARFEMGCERPTALEGLSDHLLALRAVLEGPGPVNAPLPARAAALLPDGPDRDDANFRIERAQRLERTLMSGGPLEPRGEDSSSALELAAWVEGCTRSILRDGALGYFGDDLCAAADETLIADGLDAGEPADSPQMGGTAEWDALDPEAAEESEAPELAEQPEAEAEEPGTAEELAEPQPATGEISVTRISPDPDPDPEPEPGEEEPTQAFEAIPTVESEPAEGTDDWFEEFDEQGDLTGEDDVINSDWHDEDDSRSATLEWPIEAGESRRSEDERERVSSPRVRHLFPVPEDADWGVSELEYDRNRRARVS